MARDAIHAVGTVSGTDLEIRHAPHRAEDGPASVVANSDHLVCLDWKPELNDVPIMIGLACHCEQILSAKTRSRGLRS